MKPKVEPARDVAHIAAEAAERSGVAEVLRKHGERIFTQIEECEMFVENSPVDPTSTFFGLSMPIATALLHYSTSKRKLEDATTWVTENWMDRDQPGDPLEMLAVLTLIHIVNEGTRVHRKPRQKAELWSRILQRIATLTRQPQAA